jgi:uncharacterized protein (TIGR02996 family)
MNEAAFHAALRENPADELTWQALADWLDEDGQGQRAELLRLVRRMLPTPVGERGDMPERHAALLEAGVRPVVVEMTNSIGMRFALVPAGRFLMGSPEDEQGREGEETSHEVELTRPFWLGVFTVTQGQWKAVMGDNPSYFSRSLGDGRMQEVSDAELDLFPVERVSWEDVQHFLKKLTALPEETKNRRDYRLPTEAEWEYACRGGADSSSLPFHFDRPSASLHSSQANFNGNHPYGGAARGPYLNRPCKVGSYKPNRLGLFDVHGNVFEWCLDWYDEYPSTPVTDPLGPASGSVRVIRGGGWSNYGQYCRAASRNRYAPSDRSVSLGFRAAAAPYKLGWAWRAWDGVRYKPQHDRSPPPISGKRTMP